MVHNPSVLILDEPAAGLDPRARIELREMIGQLAADGKTCLISSHILTELAEMCDLVGIIEQGQLLAVGSVEEIQHGGGHDQDIALVAEKVVKLRVLENTDALAAWLHARDDLTCVVPNGELVSFIHWHDVAWEAELLRELIVAGFRIASYGGQAKSLEDVFLQVTRGRVQ
jgi:ABC-2 type transport system ATP-binding protein